MTNKQGMNFNELKLTFVRFWVANRQIIHSTSQASARVRTAKCQQNVLPL